MKYQIWRMFASLLTVLALGAVASASASAEACHSQPGSKKLALCVEGQLKSSEAFTSHLVSGSQTSLNYLTEEWNISPCEVVTGAGSLQPLPKQTQFTFKNCQVVERPSCKVSKMTTGELEGTSVLTPESIRFSVSGGAPNFINPFKFEGSSCSRNGTVREATGTQTCTLKHVESEAASHELLCEPAGSNLLEFRKPVQLTLHEVLELSSKKPFSIIENAS